jgi:hypothetical protein
VSLGYRLKISGLLPRKKLEQEKLDIKYRRDIRHFCPIESERLALEPVEVETFVIDESTTGREVSNTERLET